MGSACFAPSLLLQLYLQKEYWSLEGGWFQVGYSQLNEKVSLAAFAKLEVILTQGFFLAQEFC